MAILYQAWTLTEAAFPQDISARDFVLAVNSTEQLHAARLKGARLKVTRAEARELRHRRYLRQILSYLRGRRRAIENEIKRLRSKIEEAESEQKVKTPFGS